MGSRDASQVQLDFPELVADIIGQLNLTGTVGVLGFSDQVTPVYIVAQRAGALAITLTPPLFASAAIFSGSAANPVANTILADTGPLPAGDYDIFASMVVRASAVANSFMVLQHRDAGAGATLAELLLLPLDGTVVAAEVVLQSMLYTLALNESLRVLTSTNTIAGVVACVIGAVIRPTP